MRGRWPASEKCFCIFAADHRVFEETARISVDFRVRELGHAHVAYGIKYLTRCDGSRVKTGQIAVSQNGFPGFRQAQTNGHNDETILIIVLENAVAITKAALLCGQALRRSGREFDAVDIFADVFQFDAVGTDVLNRR